MGPQERLGAGGLPWGWEWQDPSVRAELLIDHGADLGRGGREAVTGHSGLSRCCSVHTREPPGGVGRTKPPEKSQAELGWRQGAEQTPSKSALTLGKTLHFQGLSFSILEMG